MNYKCIIFDCDGTLVDSEPISVKIFQEMAAELGLYIDSETATEQFTGASMSENLKFIGKNLKGDLPENFELEFRKRTYKAFKNNLRPIDGVHDLIDKLDVPFCVASSGPVEKIRLNLTTTKLIDKFEGRIFSSYKIKSWKPDPGIYLHVAKQMGFLPKECIVVEDSVSGIKAAIAGGFKVYAYGNEEKKEEFKKYGSTVFFNMDELSSLLNL